MLVEPENIEVTARQLTTVIGEPPHTFSETEYSWALDTAGGPEIAGGGTWLILSVPRDEDEQKRARDHPGIYEVALLMDSDDKERTVMTPYGRLMLVPR